MNYKNGNKDRYYVHIYIINSLNKKKNINQNLFIRKLMAGIKKNQH